MIQKQGLKQNALTMDWNEMSFSETTESDQNITKIQERKDQNLVQDQPVA